MYQLHRQPHLSGCGCFYASVDILFQKEYSYIYDEGRIIRAVECDVTIDNAGMITSKSLVHALRYVYDEQGNLIRKHSIPATSPQQITFYENPEDGNPVVKFQLSQSRSVTSHSKNDSFGRKEFDELQLGLGNISRQFLYHAGQVTEEHKSGSKLKSSPTTNLVSQIILSDGRTLSYEYDAEERITKVTETADDGSDTVTVYTYDALGQLLTETVNDVVVNTMTYDSYGNILTKNGKTYTYGDGVWKDKLTAYDGQSIIYDAQGNPTSYLGHTLTWEKGRQLKSFDSNTYTYNANGIRTSKTVNGEKHTYMLDGAKILCETWQGIDIEGHACTNVMMPLYDNEDSVCGILYNSMDYYFLRNLQGDIIAITNTFGRTVAKYSYDAWGVCTIVEDSSGLNIAAINPFRYRGYYYDSEIGMYYLQSRYYDSVVGRFLNGDDCDFLYRFKGSLEALNCCNYCASDPINKTDPTGRWRLPKLVATGIQLEVTALSISLGLEIIFANGKAYLYRYVGCALGNIFDDLMSWLKSAFTGSFKVSKIKKSLKKYISASASLCVFAVFDSVYSTFKYNDYTKSFVGFSVTIPTIYGVGIKTYVSGWGSITTVGVGFAIPSSFDYGGAYTYYSYVGTLNLSESIKKFVSKETKGLKP